MIELYFVSLMEPGVISLLFWNLFWKWHLKNRFLFLSSGDRLWDGKVVNVGSYQWSNSPGNLKTLRRLAALLPSETASLLIVVCGLRSSSFLQYSCGSTSLWPVSEGRVACHVTTGRHLNITKCWPKPCISRSKLKVRTWGLTPPLQIPYSTRIRSVFLACFRVCRLK